MADKQSSCVSQCLRSPHAGWVIAKSCNWFKLPPFMVNNELSWRDWHGGSRAFWECSICSWIPALIGCYCNWQSPCCWGGVDQCTYSSSVLCTQLAMISRGEWSRHHSHMTHWQLQAQCVGLTARNRLHPSISDVWQSESNANRNLRLSCSIELKKCFSPFLRYHQYPHLFIYLCIYIIWSQL